MAVISDRVMVYVGCDVTQNYKKNRLVSHFNEIIKPQFCELTKNNRNASQNSIFKLSDL
jgi:hypothetical protein